MRQIAFVAVVVGMTVAIGGGASTVHAESSDSADIVVEVSGLEDENGVVRCGLYTESSWLDAEEAVEWVDAEYGEEETARCTFEAIDSGVYGVGAFHDQDADHDMDSNLFGVPTEGVCASNDPEPKLRAPRFDGAKFEHDTSERTFVPCTMRY